MQHYVDDGFQMVAPIDHDAALFFVGDAAAQEWLPRSGRALVPLLESELKLWTLWFKRVDHPYSYGFESSASMRVYRQHAPLFETGHNAFRVAPGIRDAIEHREKKIMLCPTTRAYTRSDSKERATLLNTLGQPLPRIGHISGGIAQRWRRELESHTSPGSLARMVRDLLPDRRRRTGAVEALRLVPEFVPYREIVPELVEELLGANDVARKLWYPVQERLLLLYLQSSCEAMGTVVPSVNGLWATYQLPRGMVNYEFSLFRRVLRHLAIAEAVARLPDRELLTLKASGEFQCAREWIKRTWREIGDLDQAAVRVRRTTMVEHGKRFYCRASGVAKRVSPYVAIAVFTANPGLQRLCAGISAVGVSELLDLLLRVFAQFDSTPMLDLRDRVVELCPPP